MKKIIQLSDLHFSRNNQLLFGKIDAEQCFDLLTPEIVEQNPDYIFITGDISQDGSPESYVKIKEKLTQFPCPKYVIPGNHDNVNNFKYLLSSDIFQVNYLDIAHHRFIFVDTTKSGSDTGIITQDELDKITGNFHPENHYNSIIMHHNFLPSLTASDRYMIENHLDFIDFLQINWAKIKNIFHGHVHNGYQSCIPLTSTMIYACPATCVQFDPSDKLILNYNIGFRVIMVDETINIKSFPHFYQNSQKL